MQSNFTRREFLKTAGVATLASAAIPGSHAAEPEKTVTLAFVGCAHIHTPGFIDLLNRRKDVKVKLVWDHDQARAEKHAKRLKANVAPAVQDIWSDSEIAAVVICSETNRHHDL